jgi:hypothetical protein
MINSWSVLWKCYIFSLRKELNFKYQMNFRLKGLGEFHINKAVERLYTQRGFKDCINRCFTINEVWL